jgi:hypothetical protein
MTLARTADRPGMAHWWMPLPSVVVPIMLLFIFTDASAHVAIHRARSGSDGSAMCDSGRDETKKKPPAKRRARDAMQTDASCIATASLIHPTCSFVSEPDPDAGPADPNSGKAADRSGFSPSLFFRRRAPDAAGRVAFVDLTAGDRGISLLVSPPRALRSGRHFGLGSVPSFLVK